MERQESQDDPLPAVGSMTLDEIEKAMIEKSIRHHGGQHQHAWPSRSA